MSARKKIKNQMCIYCQDSQSGPSTRDHVPPRSIYGYPLPKQLLTVPSCKKCNQIFSSDDEYFSQIVFDNKASETESGRIAAKAVFRSVEHNKKMQRELLKSMQHVEVITEMNLYLEAVRQVEFYNLKLRNSREIMRRIPILQV